MAEGLPPGRRASVEGIGGGGALKSGWAGPRENACGGDPIRRMLVVLVVVVALAGCGTAYMAATDERSVGAQFDDTAIVAKIRKAFLDSAKEALPLTVFCHQRLVVLAGVVEDPRVGERAVGAARAVEGVRQVETYFVLRQPSRLSDFGIATKIKAKIVGDPDLRIGQVDLDVFAGNVVLAGVVSRREKIDEIVRLARSADGVVAVKSFLQLKAR